MAMGISARMCITMGRTYNDRIGFYIGLVASCYWRWRVTHFLFVLVFLFAKERPHRTGVDGKRGQDSTGQRASTAAVAADAAGGIGSGSSGGIGQENWRGPRTEEPSTFAWREEGMD